MVLASPRCAIGIAIARPLDGRGKEWTSGPGDLVRASVGLRCRRMTMAETNDRPAWVELSSPDAAASRDFYSKLFGWQVDVSPDPQYGGYAVARIGGDDVAGIGPKMSPEAPTAWGLYIGTDDIEGLSRKVAGAGG